MSTEGGASGVELRCEVVVDILNDLVELIGLGCDLGVHIGEVLLQSSDCCVDGSHS